MLIVRMDALGCYKMLLNMKKKHKRWVFQKIFVHLQQNKNIIVYV